MFMKDREAHIVCGLGFGDEGKGITLARIAADAAGRFKENEVAIVRASGGPQNAHNVCWKDDQGNSRHHTFAQVGSSGRLWQSTGSFTAPQVPLDPISLISEADMLSGADSDLKLVARALSRQMLCADSLLVLPLHMKASRIREGRLRHGSTGRGIFEVKKFAELFPEQAPRLGDLSCPDILADKARAFARWVEQGMPVDGVRILEGEVPRGWDSGEKISGFVEFLYRDVREPFAVIRENTLSEKEWLGRLGGFPCLIYENGQGVMLDEHFGFFPNVTYSSTTPANALFIQSQLDSMLAPGPGVEGGLRVHGVIRSYATRHGAGPLPFEYPAGSGEANDLASLERHNRASFAGSVRYAPLSSDLLDYALEICDLCGGPVSDVHVTCLDQGAFSLAHTGQGNARKTARQAFGLLNGDDLARRQLILAWGEALAQADHWIDAADPMQAFGKRAVHLHSSAFEREDAGNVAHKSNDSHELSHESGIQCHA